MTDLNRVTNRLNNINVTEPQIDYLNNFENNNKLESYFMVKYIIGCVRFAR